MTNHRVRAFTIMELTIAMLISGIVIGITYTAYTIIIKTYTSFHQKNDAMAELVRLDQLLKRDIAHADLLLKSADGISMQSDSVLVTYNFQPTFIVRTSGIIDTFKVVAVDLNTSFENEPVIEFAESPEQNRLDDVSFSLNFQEEKIPYHYHKNYSSLNLFNRNPNAVH